MQRIPAYLVRGQHTLELGQAQHSQEERHSPGPGPFQVRRNRVLVPEGQRSPEPLEREQVRTLQAQWTGKHWAQERVHSLGSLAQAPVQVPGRGRPPGRQLLQGPSPGKRREQGLLRRRCSGPQCTPCRSLGPCSEC